MIVSIRLYLIILSNLIAIFLLNSCSSTPEYKSHSSTPVSKSHISCNSIHNLNDYSECVVRAEAGDADAAFNIAKLHDANRYNFSIFNTSLKLNIKQDRKTAFHWYKVAADLGHKEALRTVFESYYFGSHGPENKMKAKDYLNKSASLGHEWAMLVLAYWSEKDDPEKAMDLYLRLARSDNCHAQSKLSTIYFKGELVPKDLSKSYFWGLLASAGGMDRRSEYHYLAGLDTRSDSCLLAGEKYRAEKELESSHIQLIQDAASRWQKGQTEPELPIIQSARNEEPSFEKMRPPDSLKLSKLTKEEKTITWLPANVNLNKQLDKNLSASQLFDLINPSVWTVIAASSVANLKAMNEVSLASAVAINDENLLTNCHAVDKRPYVVVKNGERFAKALVLSGDIQTDRCILKVEDVMLSPVRGFKKYDKVSIGERVFSFGSPRGLENTLGEGIISGKREYDSLKLIQTTAQISKGSSGGGLFDSYGNLIGITTFQISDSEGLNFAISIEEFTVR